MPHDVLAAGINVGKLTQALHLPPQQGCCCHRPSACTLLMAAALPGNWLRTQTPAGGLQHHNCVTHSADCKTGGQCTSSYRCSSGCVVRIIKPAVATCTRCTCSIGVMPVPAQQQQWGMAVSGPSLLTQNCLSAAECGCKPFKLHVRPSAWLHQVLFWRILHCIPANNRDTTKATASHASGHAAS